MYTKESNIVGLLSFDKSTIFGIPVFEASEIKVSARSKGSVISFVLNDQSYEYPLISSLEKVLYHLGNKIDQFPGMDEKLL
jgi:hypothetical protein